MGIKEPKNVLYKKPIVVETKAEQENTHKSTIVPMLNGIATNQLTLRYMYAEPSTVDRIADVATIKSNTGDFSVFIADYSKLTGKLRTSTSKLLDFCVVLLTQQNTYRGKEKDINHSVRFSINDYLTACGVDDKKPIRDKMRRRLKEDLNTLYSISLEWEETIKGKEEKVKKTRICDYFSIEKGMVTFDFGNRMALYLNNSYITSYPLELLQIDERNKNVYPLLKKLYNHWHIKNNVARGTYNIISVKKLLEVCPDIPSYETVKSEDRAFERRIKEPLDTALNKRPDLLQWEYTNSKGTSLTKKQIEDNTHSSFMKLYIKFTLSKDTQNLYQ